MSDVLLLESGLMSVRQPERVVVVRWIVLHDAFAPLLVRSAEDARGERIDLVLGQELRQLRGFLRRSELLARHIARAARAA